MEANLNSLNFDLLQMEKDYGLLVQELDSVKSELAEKSQSLNRLAQEIDEMEKRKLSLESQREFLEKLKSQYEDITESMNAVIYLDKPPAEKINGLVIKVSPDAGSEDPAQPAVFKLQGEAKPIDLDAQKVKEKLAQVEESLVVLRQNKASLEAEMALINSRIDSLNNQEQDREMALANKRTVHQTVIDSYNKVKQEEEIILLELSDVTEEMSGLQEKLKVTQEHLVSVEDENKAVEASIHNEQESIALNSQLKEEVLVGIAQVKTEVENLNRRLESEESTLKMLDDTVNAGRNDILSLETKVQETANRQQGLEMQIKDLQENISRSGGEIKAKNTLLCDTQDSYGELRQSISGVLKAIEENKSCLEGLKEKSYQIQMQEKDLDFKYQSMKERLFTAYKIDLDTITAPATQVSGESGVSPEVQPQQPSAPNSAPEKPAQLFITDENLLSAEIDKLKEKVDSYGTVNLVAIEEYDE